MAYLLIVLEGIMAEIAKKLQAFFLIKIMVDI